MTEYVIVEIMYLLTTYRVNTSMITFKQYVLELQTLMFQLLESETYPEKLLIVDQMLNITHQRSDLAGMFVEGGTSTLNKLAS